MSIAKTVTKLGGCSLLAGLLLAGVMYPAAGLFGMGSNKAAQTVENTSAQLIEGEVPAVSTMVDINGDPIAWIYDQRRFEVPSDQISNEMKLAIISVEDKRFADHDGVDWQGTIRAFLTNTTSGQVEQGASTIDQQYVKNYQLLVIAQTDAERRAAVETTPARKIREIRMALELDSRLSKDEILTRYLNLVPFGNGAYGIQDAAQTYFGIDAKDLNMTQSAMLAGIVQSSSYLNPYTNYDGVMDRRNTVLDTLIENIPERASEFRAAKQETLGVLPQPKSLPQGCITAGDRGFFCDYVMQYLANVGLSREQVRRGGYLIRTSLDPKVQEATKAAVVRNANPKVEGVASVMNVIQPGREAHRVLAMASSRTYGLDGEKYETVAPQPFSMVGHGAGSIFKIFTVAAALEKGMGINAYLSVPARYNAYGLGSGGAAGCPAGYYCVENAAPYKSSMSITEALATSPNTAFVQLIQQIGVTPTMDMAVKLGLRSYTNPGSSGFTEQSLADMVKDQNIGSITLGPTAVNALELANVAATLASEGTWCPPSPVDAVFDRRGNPVPLNVQPCEQVVEPGLANAMANALGQDHVGNGTAARAANLTGWSLPMSGKTGTTEAHMSSAFLGFTNTLAGAVYVYGDSPTPSAICSDNLRQCYSGTLYGGNEPARTWFNAMSRVVGDFGDVRLPPLDRRYTQGDSSAQVPEITNLSQSSAIRRLESAGFDYSIVTVSSSSTAGVVTGYEPAGFALPGTTVTVYVSDGSQRRTTTPRTPRSTTSSRPPAVEMPELPSEIIIPGIDRPIPLPDR